MYTGAVAAALLSQACTKADPAQGAAETPSFATSIAGIGPCDSVNVDQSMVIHDQAIITAGNFSFQRTIQAIRNSSGGAITTDAALAQTLTSGLLNTSFTNPTSGLAMAANTRSAEAGLTGAGLLTDMQPIALFNRFDLAPATGANCGEYRIVYGRYPNSTFNRYLVIFEARLPNPNPGLGLAGCLPVAQFWHQLSDAALSDTQRGQMLEDFYYNGLPGFSAVVTHANYGVPLGQVRANMFMTPLWMLREWRTSFNLSGQAVFTPDTVKDNPLAEFYDETSFGTPLFISEQAAFSNDFATINMNNLLDFELNGAGVSACPEVNTVGAGFDDRYNEFQSVSQGPSDDPNSIASPAFRATIDGVLSGNSAFAGLNNSHVLARAGAMTCGGCHQFSVGQAISPTANWPGVAAGGFVHVKETGPTSPTNTPPAVVALSSALTSCFLPARAQILETFVCNASGGSDAGVTDSGVTDSGVVDSGVVDSGGTSTPCGGAYGSTCGSNEYCEFGPYNVCGAAGPGVCTPRPVNCGYTVNEVCGCDGNTYTNVCFANQAGVDVSSQGACNSNVCNLRPPAGCCFDDSQCSALKGGECIGEDCAAGQAGVCKGLPPKGGCWENADCARGEVCDGVLICGCGQVCRFTDTPGVCRSILTPVQLSQSLSTTSLSSQSTISTAQAPEAQLSDAELFTAVETAKGDLLNATTTQDAERALGTLEDAVRAARTREADQPGAFWRHRRTH
ncbi:MAG: hypothetical protein KC933_00800 [Myxococcales bacterium]|nr:hypothetical protein [Myxococcales bacterium]